MEHQPLHVAQSRPPLIGQSRASGAVARANSIAVTYYDGQGFMVNKKLGVKSAKELNGATICVAPGTTTELNLADYFRANKMTFKPVVIEKVEEVRAANAPNPDDYMVMPSPSYGGGAPEGGGGGRRPGDLRKFQI